jgi:hypothetical protein
MVALNCHFTHHSGKRVDTIKTSWHVATSPQEAEALARRKATAERMTVDSLFKVVASAPDRDDSVKSA